MNILQVMGMDSTKYGGIERFNVELAKRCQENGDRVVFVYERYPDCKDFVNDLTKLGAKLYILNSKKILQFVFGLINIIRVEKIDVLHAHFTKARFYAIPIGFIFGVKKLFFTIHSTMVRLDRIKFHTRLWFRIAIKISKVITVSNNIREVCLRNWGDKINIQTLYLGVEKIEGDKIKARSQLGIKYDELLLLTIANFNVVKGLDVLCYSVALLKKNGKLNNVKLYIVGQPQKDLDELSVLIRELDIMQEVVQVGISNKVSEYLLSSDIYIQASRHEGLPLSLMEAVSVGLPIVATKVGGIPEIVFDEENGYLVSSEDYLDLAYKLDKLISSKGLREEIGKNGRSVSELFELNRNVNKLMDLYRQ